MKKTVVLGLDGATWKLLKPFAEKGWMPTIKKILEKGVWGELESTIPPMTATSWTSFATGKNPQKHGLFDFMIPVNSLGNMRFASSDDIHDKTIYELVKEHGKTPITINLPETWPPKLPNDITITSLLTQGDQWIFPESVKQECPALQKYRLTPNESLRLKDRREEYIADLLLHLNEQVEGVKQLFIKKPWDFFFYLFSHTDWISHLAFCELIEKEDASARRIFETVDKHVAWFIERLPKNTNLIMLSDHGFTTYKKIFYLNRWLEQEGYLVTNTASEQFHGAATRRAKELDKVRSKKKRITVGSGVFKLLSAIPPLEKTARWMYHHVLKKYLPIDLKVQTGIDFSKTKACFPKGAYVTNIYINKSWVYKDGIVSKEEYPKLVAELVEKLKNLKDTEGKPVIAQVLTRDEVYGSEAPDKAPDIFFELNDYWLVGHFQSYNLFGKNIENKHAKMGVFMAYGPDFAQGKQVEGFRMPDITPLILHLMNIPIPSDCDGKVHREALADSSEAKKRTIQFGAPSARTTGQQNAPISEKQTIKSALGKIKL
ncbi:MAG TPA: alkaline phosphatase family protein [Patescibacteria group bacterium]|nr:alkaline phosphatase family protein [Patescibacteria group bacterium]